jgi:hypothetical protein
MVNVRVPMGTLFGAMALCCSVLIAGIVDNGLGGITSNLLATGTNLAFASVLAVAAIHGWHHPRARHYARPGLVLAGLALLAWLGVIWFVEQATDLELQITGTIWVFSVGLCHLAAVGSCRIPPRHAWSWPVVVGCDVLLVAVATVMLWMGERASNASVQLFALLLIATSGMSVAMMVFHVTNREPRVHG